MMVRHYLNHSPDELPEITPEYIASQRCKCGEVASVVMILRDEDDPTWRRWCEYAECLECHKIAEQSKP